MQSYFEENELNNFLFELGFDDDFYSDKEKHEQAIESLKKILSESFIISQSDLFSTIQDFFEVGNNSSEPQDTLVLNLEKIRETFVEKSNSDSTNIELRISCQKFIELFEYINLEIKRNNYFVERFSQDEITNEEVKQTEVFDNVAFMKLQEQINKVEMELKNQKPYVNDAVKNMSEIDQKLSQNSVSSITTLTIFSAVILAFSGGITFEAGVFNGLSSDMTSAYRLVFTVALSGFVLFNTIFALLYIISKLTQKNIATECKYSCPSNEILEGKRCGEFECKKPFSSKSSMCRLWHRYSYIFIINAILLTIMYSDFAYYLANRYQNNIFLFCAIAFYCISIGLLLLVRYLYCKLQYKRWEIKTANNLLRSYLQPDKQGLTRLGEYLVKLKNNFFGLKNNTKEDFINYINSKAINEMKDLKDHVSKFIKKLIEEETDIFYQHVSTSESAINKKDYELLYPKVLEKIKNPEKQLSVESSPSSPN